MWVNRNPGTQEALGKFSAVDKKLVQCKIQVAVFEYYFAFNSSELPLQPNES